MPLRIDGSHGEGGGQILRTALALSALLHKPVEIGNIRAGRKKPGLRAQHLAAVRAMALISEARLEGAELGSTRLCFEPRNIVPGDYSLDIGTAGSTSLVLQTMLPALLFAGRVSRVVVSGGTHVPWSPCFHYLKKVFLPALGRMGSRTGVELQRWGWYPKGGGRVTASISSLTGLRCLDLSERGDLQDLYLLSAVSNLPMSIGERQKDEVVRQLADRGYEISRVEVLDGPSVGQGTAVFLGAGFESGVAGFTSLGKKGKPAEKVADEVCSDFFSFLDSRASVDDHLSDQLLLYMALAKGRSFLRVRAITEHLRTNLWVIRQFMPIEVELDETGGRISLEGIG